MPHDVAGITAATNAPFSAVPLPSDITGHLPAPDTPKPKNGKGKKRDKAKKAVRKGRAACVRSPVLVIVLGRQLGKPTAAALKQIAKGVALDDIAVDAPNVPGNSQVPVPE